MTRIKIVRTDISFNSTPSPKNCEVTLQALAGSDETTPNEKVFKILLPNVTVVPPYVSDWPDECNLLIVIVSKVVMAGMLYRKIFGPDL
jgi:hypothetical protein